MVAQSSVSMLRDNLTLTGQKKWGFVIYRCTYGDDAMWDRFMQICNERIVLIFDKWGEDHSLLDQLDLKVFADAALDGATKADVRARFNEWTQTDEAKAEQGTAVIPVVDEMRVGGFSPRYFFCIHVDRESLESVVNHAPQPPARDRHGVGWVNLIQGSYEAESDPDESDGEDPIEGCTDENVGWQKAGLDNLMPSVYTVLQKPEAFYDEYVRPPGVYCS